MDFIRVHLFLFHSSLWGRVDSMLEIQPRVSLTQRTLLIYTPYSLFLYTYYNVYNYIQIVHIYYICLLYTYNLKYYSL